MTWGCRVLIMGVGCAVCVNPAKLLKRKKADPGKDPPFEKRASGKLNQMLRLLQQQVHLLMLQQPALLRLSPLQQVLLLRQPF